MAEIVIALIVVIGAIAIFMAILPALITLLRGLLALAFGLGGIVLGWSVAQEMLRDPKLESPWSAIIAGVVIACIGLWLAGKISPKGKEYVQQSQGRPYVEGSKGKENVQQSQGRPYVEGTSTNYSGTKLQTCTSCAGRGNQACMQWGGGGGKWGEGTCPKCGDSGKESCWTCHGMGTVIS